MLQYRYNYQIRIIMSTPTTKERLHPYRVLTIMLYGELDCLTRLGKGRVRVRIGPLARILRVPNHRLKDYISWLGDRGLVSEVDHEFGYASVTIPAPVGMAIIEE